MEQKNQDYQEHHSCKIAQKCFPYIEILDNIERDEVVIFVFIKVVANVGVIFSAHRFAFVLNLLKQEWEPPKEAPVNGLQIA